MAGISYQDVIITVKNHLNRLPYLNKKCIHSLLCGAVCNNMSAGGIKETPFLCLDLTYISVLLQELDFPPDKELKVCYS